MNENIRFRKTLEFRPRSFDSEAKASQSLTQRLGAGLYSLVESWAGHNDQICIKTISERKVVDQGIERMEEEVISTGIYKETIEKFSKGELSGENSNRVIEFLSEATDQNLSNLNEKQIQNLSKLILTSPDKLDCIKTLLRSPNVTDLLPAFADNTGLLIALDSTILNQIILLDQAIPVIKVLGEYPMWQLNRDLLKEILKMSVPHERLSLLSNFPRLGTEFLPIIQATLAMPLSFLEQALKILDNFPRDFLQKSPVELWDKMLDSSDPDRVFAALGDRPELLQDEKLMNLMDKILSSDAPGFILRVLGNHPGWLKNEKFMSVMDKMLTSANPGSVFAALGDRPGLLQNEQFMSLLDKVLASSDPGSVFAALGNHLKLLQNEQFMSLMDKILASSDPGNVIRGLGDHPEWLQNEKFMSVLDKILASSDPGNVIRGLGDHPEWLQNEQFMSLMDKILTASKPYWVIRALGKYPELLQNEKLMSLMDKILALAQPGYVLEALGNHPEWLQNEKFMSVLDKILTASKPDWVIRVLGKYPELLQNEKLMSLMDKILALAQPGYVLEVLGEHTELLRNHIVMSLMDKILASSNPGSLIEDLGGHPEWLQNEQFMSLLDKILASSNPGSLIEDLGGHPEWLQNEQFMSLLDKILTSSKPDWVIQALGKYPELLQNEKFMSLLDKILASSNPGSVIEDLGGHPEFLQNEKLTLEHWDKILSFEPVKVLKQLVERPDLLQDSVFLDKMLQSKNLLQTLEWMRWGKYITISSEGYTPEHSNLPKAYLNQDLFIEPPSDEWNILPQREGPIVERDWAFIQARLADIFDTVYKERDNERDRLFRFLGQCMGTKDAETPAGKQRIRKRVEAVVVVLEKYVIEMNETTNNERKEAIRKNLIGRTLDIMAMGGSACPDNAIVLLRQAENHIKLFENPQYLAHIIVNMYKLHCIMELLTDPDNAENVETYLSYTLKLSDLLGLGISGDMLYEFHYGKTEPFEKALPILSKGFTAEKLIKFTTELEEFRSRFEEAKENALKAKQEEYVATYDMEDEKQAEVDRERITGKLKDMENSFLANTARQILIDAGFLTTQ